MKKQSTSKSFAILGTTSIIVKVLAIIYLPFQTMILGNEGNGIVANGYNVFLFLFSFSNAGLPNAISKLVAEQTTHGNFKAANKILKCAYMVMLVLGVIIALFMALGARTLAKFANDDRTYYMFLVLSPTLVFTSVSCALRGYFQGRQNMIPVAISNVVEQLLNSIFTVVFAWLLIKHGIAAGAAGTAVGTIVGAIGAAAFLCYVFFILSGKHIKREIRNTAPELPQPKTSDVYREILKYSFPAIINTVATCAVGLIDTFNCTRRLETIRVAGKAVYNSSQASSLFGIYSYQYQRLFTLAIAFSTALVTSMIPAISEAIALRDHRLIKYRISESYKAIYLLTIPSIAGISFLAQPLITLVFVHHNSGADLVQFGTWTAIFMTIQYVQSGVLISAGKPMAPSVNLIIGMAAKMALNYVLIPIPSINIKGAIIGTSVGWVIAIILNQISINKSFHFKIYFIRMMIRPAFASVIMGVICMFFYKGVYFVIHLAIRQYVIASDITVILSALFGAAIYFGVMVLIGGATKKDIKRLPMGGKIYSIVSKVPMLRARLEH